MVDGAKFDGGRVRKDWGKLQKNVTLRSRFFFPTFGISNYNHKIYLSKINSFLKIQLKRVIHYH